MVYRYQDVDTRGIFKSTSSMFKELNKTMCKRKYENIFLTSRAQHNKIIYRSNVSFRAEM